MAYLHAPSMKKLMRDLRADYDVILVDSPPLGACVDPLILAVTGHEALWVEPVSRFDRMLAMALGILARDGLWILADDVYEDPVATQIKQQGVPSGSTAVFSLRLQNDGNLNDGLRVTGPAGASGFSVVYLDETSTDRTAAVTGAGAGASTVSSFLRNQLSMGLGSGGR